MYNRIRNPKTQRMVSIHGKLGRQILKNYISFLMGGSKNKQSGGGVTPDEEKTVYVLVTASWCGPCDRFKAGGDGGDTASKVVAELRNNNKTVYWFDNNQNETKPFDDETKNNPPSEKMCADIIAAIQGYPTIMKGNGSNWEYFNGVRTAEGVMGWAE